MGLRLGSRRALFGASGLTYAQKVLAIPNLLAYWKLDETSGTNAADSSGNGYNGTYSGVTLGNAAGPGAGMGLAPLWDAVNDDISLPAGVRSGLTGSEGTISFWAKVSAAAIWTTPATRRAFCFTDSGFVDTFDFRTSSTTNHQVIFDFILGSNNDSITYTFPSSGPTGWFNAILRWSKSNDRFRTYINGVQVGSTATGLGVYGATLDTAFIGSFDGSLQGWDGWLQHFVVINRECTDTEIATLATAV